MSDNSQSLTIAIDTSDQILMDQILANQAFIDSGYDEARLLEAASKGAVWTQIRHSETVSSRPARIRDLTTRADKPALLLININTKVLDESPLLPTLELQEQNYSIWNKPSGMLCQGTRWGDHCSLARVVEQTLGRPVHLVHRLDKAARGLILLAHTRPATKALSSLFANRRVRKIYRATVFGQVDWTLPRVIDEAIDGRQARTLVLSVDVDAEQGTSCLSVQIETGRKHQIRQHLARAGYPIVGDRLFDPAREHVRDLQLSAIEMGFECPFSGKEILVRCD